MLAEMGENVDAMAAVSIINCFCLVVKIEYRSFPGWGCKRGVLSVGRPSAEASWLLFISPWLFFRVEGYVHWGLMWSTMCSGYEANMLSSTFIKFGKSVIPSIAFLCVKVVKASKHKVFCVATMLLRDRQSWTIQLTQSNLWQWLVHLCFTCVYVRWSKQLAACHCHELEYSVIWPQSAHTHVFPPVGHYPYYSLRQHSSWNNIWVEATVHWSDVVGR